MQLIDQFNRKVDYIRVSVTDRCDFRCVYCMSEKMTFLPKSTVLSNGFVDNISVEALIVFSIRTSVFLISVGNSPYSLTKTLNDSGIPGSMR